MKKIFAIFMLVGTLLSFNIITEARDVKMRDLFGENSGVTLNNSPQVRYRYRRYYRPRYVRYRYYRPVRYRYYRPVSYRVIRIPRIRYRRTYYTTYRYRTYRTVPRYRRVYVRRY
jgi:hypothetical protein